MSGNFKSGSLSVNQFGILDKIEHSFSSDSLVTVKVLSINLITNIEISINDILYNNSILSAVDQEVKNIPVSAGEYLSITGSGSDADNGIFHIRGTEIIKNTQSVSDF